MESVTYDDFRVSRRNRYDGDGSFGEVTVGKPRSIEELRQCFFECQIATGAAGPVHADEFAAIDNLNVSFPGEGLQRAQGWAARRFGAFPSRLLFRFQRSPPPCAGRRWHRRRGRARQRALAISRAPSRVSPAGRALALRVLPGLKDTSPGRSAVNRCCLGSFGGIKVLSD